MSERRHFTPEQAREVGEAIGIDWGSALAPMEFDAEADWRDR